MDDKDLQVVECMERYGGSFIQALAQCFHHADATNVSKLKVTFAGYWKQYSAIAKIDMSRSKKQKQGFRLYLEASYTKNGTCTGGGAHIDYDDGTQANLAELDPQELILKFLSM